jgi:hypothetical protein
VGELARRNHEEWRHQHDWDGPPVCIGFVDVASCSLCGADASEQRPCLSIGEQNRDEFKWLVRVARAAACKSVLEIGARECLMLGALGRALGATKLRGIEIHAGYGTLDGVSRLRANGVDAECLIADSAAAHAAFWARNSAPYGLVFIDGDHDCAIFSDWINYGTLGKLVALHDIANPRHRVQELWALLKTRKGAMEFVAPGSQMGIGVIPGGHARIGCRSMPYNRRLTEEMRQRYRDAAIARARNMSPDERERINNKISASMKLARASSAPPAYSPPQEYAAMYADLKTKVGTAEAKRLVQDHAALADKRAHAGA